MKKILFVVLALLLGLGVVNSYATNIPMATDPKNYPTVWTELVYNGSGSDITSTTTVLWDFATSDSDAGTIFDDMCPWIKVDNDEASPWTAGVTTGASVGIVNGAVGRIIIRGPAVVNGKANATTANALVSTDGSGSVIDESASAGEALLGVCIQASAAGNDIEGNFGADWALIYIDPTLVGGA
jgi:hypothetical protein